MAWTKNGTPDTLGSAGDVMTISDLTASKFNQFLCHTLDDGSATRGVLTFDNDGASTNYARRLSQDGASDATQVSHANYKLNNAANASDEFMVIYGVDIAAEEKIMIVFIVDEAASGAGTAPSRTESVGKWVNTSVQYGEIDIDNDQAGSYVTSSNLSALGSDGVEELNVQDGAVYYDKTLNKEYVLNNNAWTEV